MSLPEIAVSVRCIRCGKTLVREEPSEAFFSCGGYNEFVHPLYLVSSGFVLDRKPEKLKPEAGNDKIGEDSEP